MPINSRHRQHFTQQSCDTIEEETVQSIAAIQPDNTAHLIEEMLGNNGACICNIEITHTLYINNGCSTQTQHHIVCIESKKVEWKLDTYDCLLSSKKS